MLSAQTRSWYCGTVCRFAQNTQITPTRKTLFLTLSLPLTSDTHILSARTHTHTHTHTHTQRCLCLSFLTLLTRTHVVHTNRDLVLQNSMPLCTKLESCTLHTHTHAHKHTLARTLPLCTKLDSRTPHTHIHAYTHAYTHTGTHIVAVHKT